MTFSSLLSPRHAVALAVLFLATLPVTAATIHVPSDQSTIQAAIDSSVDGDTILVADGTYKENIDFKGKAITVKSTNGAATTIVDGSKIDYVVKFVTKESPASVLDGFTITNGYPGGINIGGSSPTVVNNIITANTGCSGIGINIDFAAPLIQNNVISNNVQVGCSGGVGGGGIEAIGAANGAQIIGNIITGNNSGSGARGGGIGLWTPGPVLIQGNLISGNTGSEGGGIGGANDTSGVSIIENVIIGNSSLDTGGGIEIDNIVVLVLNNTIADNDGPGGGSGFYGAFSTQIGAMSVINNLIIGKSGQSALGCRAFDTNNLPVFTFNDVFSPGGLSYGAICVDQTGQNGNISADPVFVNPVTSDFHLQATSPAIDAGSNNASSLPAKDISGNDRILDGKGKCTATVDLGAYEFARSSVLSLSPAILSFADQDIGSTSAILSSKITNTASTPLTVCHFSISGDFSQMNTCGSAIPSKGTCAVNVSFTPRVHGARSGFLQVITNDAGSPQSISLSGKGVLPSVALSTAALSFTAQAVGTASASQSITLTNTGDGRLSISNVAVTGDFSESDTCGNAVAPLATCAYRVTFAPSASGNRTGSLTISDNAGGSPHAIALTGSATDFALAAAPGGSTTATVSAGNTATYSLQVSPLNGFTGTVTLTCAGAPLLATCTVVPTSAAVNGSLPATFQATAGTVAPSMTAFRTLPGNWPPLPHQWWVVPLPLALLLLTLRASFTARALGRKINIVYSLALVSVLFMSACGGSSSSIVHMPGTPKGNYTLTVTGSSGGVSRTQNLTLTVN
jgi:hypothetical protein